MVCDDNCETDVSQRLKRNFVQARWRRDRSSWHYGPELNNQESRQKYWATRSSVRSHRSLVRLLRTIHFARSFARSFTHSRVRGTVNDLMAIFSVFFLFWTILHGIGSWLMPSWWFHLAIFRRTGGERVEVMANTEWITVEEDHGRFSASVDEYLWQLLFTFHPERRISRFLDSVSVDKWFEKVKDRARKEIWILIWSFLFL